MFTLFADDHLVYYKCYHNIAVSCTKNRIKHDQKQKKKKERNVHMNDPVCLVIMSLCSSSYLKLRRWKISKTKTKCILTLNVNERKWQQPHLNFQVLFQTWTELTHWCPLPSLSWKMMLQSSQFKIVWIVNSLFPVSHITAWWHFPLSQFVSEWLRCMYSSCLLHRLYHH